MEISKRMQRRILIQTIFFAAVFLAIGASFGYYVASMQAANQILTELAK